MRTKRSVAAWALVLAPVLAPVLVLALVASLQPQLLAAYTRAASASMPTTISAKV